MAVLNGAPEAKKSRISFYTVLYHPERGVFAGPGYLLHSEYAEKVGLPMSGRAFDRMTRALQSRSSQQINRYRYERRCWSKI